MSSRGQRFATHARIDAWTRGRGRDVVGNAIYHTVGNREEATAQLSKGFAALQNEIMTRAGWRADPYHAAEGPIWEWWKLAGLPIVELWQAFQAMQTASYGERWSTDWDVYKTWLANLRKLRAAAQAYGIKLVSPEPSDLSTTVWEDVGDLAGRAGKAAAGAAGDVWTLAKVAIYGGLGLVGAIAISSLVSNLKHGKDPAANYMALARTGARSARYAAL